MHHDLHKLLLVALISATLHKNSNREFSLLRQREEEKIRERLYK